MRRCAARRDVFLLLCLAATAAPAQNRVLELDGTGAHVELPAAVFDSLREATVEAWVRWDDWVYFSQWFAYDTGQTWRGIGINHFDGDATLQAFVYTGEQDHVSVVRRGVNLPPGQWCHTAAVFGPQGLRLYVNGALVARDEFTGSFADVGPAIAVRLGLSPWEENQPFHGALDEVRLWSVERTGEQIRRDLGRRLNGNEPDLVGLWTFDAGDARDATPGGNDGALRSGARIAAAPFPGSTVPLTPVAIVSGRAQDESGTPLFDATVRFVSATGVEGKTNTDEDGDFSIALLDTGLYNVDVFSPLITIPRRPLRVVGDLPGLGLRPPPPSLRASWAGEGDARDDAGGAHGRLVGEASFADGVVGQAFDFAGTMGNGVRVPNDPSLVPDQDFSVLAWVYPEADRKMCIVGVWGDGEPTDNQRAWFLHVASGMRLDFSISDDAGQLEENLHASPTRPNVLPLKAWTLVAGVWDADAGERRLYANGVLLTQRTDSIGPLTRSIADLGIGGHVSNPNLVGRPFAGRIDEVRLYDVAVGQDEITRLYSAHARARWSGEGTPLDGTRSGHDGIAVGPVRYVNGMTGEAFSFDGDAYVEFDARIGNYGAEDFTAELWVRPDGRASAGTLLAKHQNDGEALALRLDAQRHVECHLSSSGDSVYVASPHPLSPNDWHHIAVVRREQDVSLYVDGELSAAATSDHPVWLETRSPLLLGGAPARASFFVGQLDEVALHNRALSPAQIQAAYATNLDVWRWRLWRGRLELGGGILVIGLALLMGVRYVVQRRQRRIQREQLLEARSARQIADAANEAKSAFLANMSHEIRTPMNAILGYAQVLRDESSLTPEQRRNMEAIYDNGSHLLQLINDVLDLSKVEAGRMELAPGDFDLAHLVDGLSTLFELRCRQKGLRFEVERGTDVGAVRGDEAKLRQVLVNLLGNAVKFTDKGFVRLAVRRQAERHRFDVNDSGPGIAPEQQGTMFEPFQQGASGRAEGGTGLGLSIARRHVELMGGRLRLDTDRAQGAHFWFELNLPAAASRPLPAVHAVAERATPRDEEPHEEYAGMALPGALRGRLRQAAQMHNVTEVKLCLEHLQGLGEREARLAASLSRAVARYELGPVLDAVEGTVDA